MRPEVLAGGALILAAATLGAAMVAAPIVAVGAVGLLLVSGLASWAVAVPFGLALLAVSYSPENVTGLGPLSEPETQKGLLLIGLLPLVLSLGVRPRFLLPVIAYLAMGLMALVHDDLTPGLTASQMASSLITLSLGWVVLALAWDRERDAKLLKLVTVLPFACLAFGLVLQAAGLHEMFRPTDQGDVFPRLQGASIPPQLAMGAFIGSATAFICHRQYGWRWGIWLTLANAALVVMTVSRGAAIALLIALAWPALRFGVESLSRHPGTGVLRVGALALAVIAVVAVAVPRLESRGSGPATYYPGQTASSSTDRTSGREEAWKEFYEIGEQSPLFGHGLGSGPITKIRQEGFQAQHNEYLRLFVEGGYIGGGLVVLSLIGVVAAAIRGSPRRVRMDLTGIAIAFAVLAVTDNPLNSLVVAVPFCLLLGVCSGRSLPARAQGDLRWA